VQESIVARSVAVLQLADQIGFGEGLGVHT
jgi:hypothetical protein